MASPQDGGKRPQVSPGRLFGLGFEIAVPVVLLMYAGYRLDRWLDSTPWWFLVGSLLGVVVGFYNFFRRVLPPRQGPKSGRR